MKHPFVPTSLRLMAAVALIATASLAQAQYMWIDQKGLKQFSDRPPPPSVPLKNILKAPRGVLPAPAPADAAAPPATVAKAPAVTTYIEREAESRKRGKELAEREQKDKEEAAQVAARAENCDRAARAKVTLESGVRIGTTDKNGERSYMSDEQRALESKRVNQIVAGCRT